MKLRLLSSILSIGLIALMATTAARAKAATPRNSHKPKATTASTVTLDLRDFGAVGDGTTDDGPALQSALAALAAAGGGTLNVPAGKYAIITPVAEDFKGLGASIKISGVSSDTPAPLPTADGNQLTRGLDLTSEFLPKTRAGQVAVSIHGLDSLLVADVAFVGTPETIDDALVTLYVKNVADATIRHCEFYGLSSLEDGGAVVESVRSNLKVEQSVFLGCAAGSDVYGSIVQNLEWKGITVTDSVFTDYGQRPALFGKLGYGSPFSWINVGNAAATDNESPRREAVFRNVFFDEGGLGGITSLPARYQPPSAPIDLLYISGLRMNDSNLGTAGLYLSGLRNVLVENSFHGWSQTAGPAVDIVGAGDAILDRVVCADGVTTLSADAATARLSVIDSTYTTLDSHAQLTNVITTSTPVDDPVQYVGARFQSALGREPDAAAHFYWSDELLRCGDDAACIAASRAALDEYLDASPSPTFALNGLITDENGEPLNGVSVTVSGSLSATTETDASGFYHFANLPTSGDYTITASKRHYTLAPSSSAFTTPVTDIRGDFVATLDRHAVSGHVMRGDAPAAGVTLTLDGAASATVTTDASGNYFFGGLPAGGSYSLTPSCGVFVFSPSGRTFDDLDADQTADFTLVTHAIRGRVTDANNYALPGVTVVLSGTQSASTTTDASGGYSFTNLPAGDGYTVAPASGGLFFSPASQTFASLDGEQWAAFIGSTASTPAVVEFSSANFETWEGGSGSDFPITVTRGGDTSSVTKVVYSAKSGTAKLGSDFVGATGEITFAPGETKKSFTIFITDDAFVESAEQFTLTLSTKGNAIVGDKGTATVTINDNDATAATKNPADDSRFFVREHYRDFLNREPDDAGLAFWTGEIESCGTDAQCRETKRVNVSAAFFLSIEFQNTGYFVYRVYESALARTPRRIDEFMLDSRIIADGVVVGTDDWQRNLEANKDAFVADFVGRAEFTDKYPTSLTPAQFVAALDANTGNSLNVEEASAAAAEFGGASDTHDTGARARALRSVAENRAFASRESDRAFVLMQYYGYLRRAPDDAPDGDMSGYNFWLSKLDQLKGDFASAEMVKAFINSAEYRTRFGY